MYNGSVGLLMLCTIEPWFRHTEVRMPVIAIVNQKGGTGKTSLATNLGSALAQEQTVLLLDADAQGSSRDWAESRAVPLLNLQVRAADPGRLVQDARGFSREFNWVLIDGPAGISRVTADAVRAADAVLIPATPSPYDVWAASTIVEAVKARQQATGGRPRAAFVITRARPRTLLSRQIEAALEEYGLPALAARTTERVAYPRMAIEGRSVLDGRDRVAKAEILALRDEIARLVNDTQP